LTRSYSYDNVGNATADGTATFTYNDAGRMVSATKASVTTSYALDALGERVKKTTSGSSRYFVYDESGRLTGEYDNAGNLIEETVWLGDLPAATLRPNGAGVDVFYVHTDHLGAPRKISRPSDNVVVWRWDGDPFGTTAANQDPDGDSNPFAYGLRFPGQYFDVETGLHYNYLRDGYDSATGRYTQSDPIGLEGGINTYSYVAEDPISTIDPLGLRGTNRPSYPVNMVVPGGRITGMIYPGQFPGAQIALRFIPNSNVCSACTQYRWTQTIGTNDSRESALSEYLDQDRGSPDGPFYETATEYARNPNLFYDNITRVPRPGGPITWRSRLCLACVRGNGSFTTVVCLRYGFEIPGPNQGTRISPVEVDPRWRTRPWMR